MKVKKIPIPVSGVQAQIEAPGPVTTWAEMSPEKKAELKALYENRKPKEVIGLRPPKPKKFKIVLRKTGYDKYSRYLYGI